MRACHGDVLLNHGLPFSQSACSGLFFFFFFSHTIGKITQILSIESFKDKKEIAIARII